MAFVFCDKRWKAANPKPSPSPDQYQSVSLTNEQPTQEHINSKLLRTAKKSRLKMGAGEHKESSLLTEMILGERESRKGELKRGKIVKSRPHMSQQQSHAEKENASKERELYTVEANRQHYQSQALNTHQKAKKRKVLHSQLSASGALMMAQKEKHEEELKELKTILNANRKGNPAHRALARDSKVKSCNRFHVPREDKSTQELNICPVTTVKEQHSAKTRNTVSNNNDMTSTQRNELVDQIQRLMQKQVTEPTGIEDSFEQNSLEYIDEATPGPGSYQIQSRISKKKPHTRVESFGSTMQRFKQTIITTPSPYLQPSYPSAKTVSHAKQTEVGFGTTTKTTKQAVPLCDKFYDDARSLEYKSQQVIRKAQKNGIAFNSAKDRFIEPKKQKKFFEDEEDQYASQEEYKEPQKPNGIFMSKVSREQPLNCTTENIDYSGQNHHCLAQTMKKQKEYIEDYEIKAPGFMTSSQRFKQPVKVPRLEKEKQRKQVKMEETKKQKKVKKPSHLKGFSFQKGERAREDRVDEAPTPNCYETSPNWVKPSHNIKFI